MSALGRVERPEVFPYYIFRGHLFVMLTICLDGSGKDGDPSARFVTLAGFAAEEEGWKWLDSKWNQVLAKHPKKPQYLHMVEASSLRKGFKGWTEDEVVVLVTELCLLTAEIHRGCLFQGFRFTMDNGAHRRWKAIGDLDPIPKNVAIGMFHRAATWYIKTLPKDQIVKPLVLLFDKDEPYINVVENEWKIGNRARDFPWWGMINSISPVNMRAVPGVQAADMLAWSINRVRSSGSADWKGQLASRVIQIVPHLWNEVEEDHMRTVKLPGEMP